MGTHSRRKNSDQGKLMIDEQLREAIRASGETHYALAQRTGVSSQQIGRFVAGERDLTLSTAAKLCNALGLRFKLN